MQLYNFTLLTYIYMFGDNNYEYKNVLICFPDLLWKAKFQIGQKEFYININFDCFGNIFFYLFNQKWW